MCQLCHPLLEKRFTEFIEIDVGRKVALRVTFIFQGSFDCLFRFWYFNAAKNNVKQSAVQHKQLATETKWNVYNMRKQRNSLIYISLSSFPARWHGKWNSMLCIFIWYKKGLYLAANLIFVPFCSTTIFLKLGVAPLSSTFGPAVPLTTFLYSGLLSRNLYDNK